MQSVRSSLRASPDQDDRAADAAGACRNDHAALPLPGSDGNQLDGLVAFICWRAASGSRASCCSGGARPDVRRPSVGRSEASRRHDGCCSGPVVYGGTLPENGARLAHLLGVPGRRRHPDRAEMGPATRLENRPDPMANSAQAKRTGRHPDLRLSRRSPAHDAAHSAVQDRVGVCQTRRRSELARLREDLHPRQRQGAAGSARGGAKHSRQCGALHEIPGPPPQAAPAGCGQRITLESSGEGVSPNDRRQEPRPGVLG